MPTTPRLSRRVFVRGLLGGSLAGGWIACGDSAAPSARPSDDAGAGPAPCPPFLTPLSEFFQQFGGSRTVDGWSMPDLAEDTPLELTGLVATPTTLRLSDLEAEHASHVTVLNTLMCVLGSRGTAIWTGVPLRGLLDRAGIDRALARRVRFFGADGFENNLKLADIYDSPPEIFEPLLAFRIGGERLPRELGFPVRLLLADRFGFKNTKWLVRIEVTDSDAETGQYQERGYPDAGVIAPVPIVESHRVAESVAAGRVRICGFALSGYAAVDSVEVALDAAAYAPARIGSAQELLARHPELAATLQFENTDRFSFPLRGIWVAWETTLDLVAGEHTVAVRLHDASGNVADATTLRLTALG